MEKEQRYEVRCIPHGLLAIITQAHLGLNIFEAHRLKSENCLEAEIKPILRETMSNKQLEEFNSEVILTLTLNQMEMVKRQNEKIRRNNGKATLYRRP